jgi:hypothetical protein
MHVEHALLAMLVGQLWNSETFEHALLYIFEQP